MGVSVKTRLRVAGFTHIGCACGRSIVDRTGFVGRRHGTVGRARSSGVNSTDRNARTLSVIFIRPFFGSGI